MEEELMEINDIWWDRGTQPWVLEAIMDALLEEEPVWVDFGEERPYRGPLVVEGEEIRGLSMVAINDPDEALFIPTDQVEALIGLRTGRVYHMDATYEWPSEQRAVD